MTKVSADDGARTWLVFALGRYVMCASALDVEAIIQRPDAIARFPLTPDYALGAFLFRGRSAAAISLRKKLKLREGEDDATGPFIVASVRDALVAFWVDEVRDVIEEKDVEWCAMPAMLEGGLFDRLATHDGQLILQTSFAALRDANVEFESFAAQLAACTGASLAPAAPEAPSEGSGALSSPGALPGGEPEPVPESAPGKEVENEEVKNAGSELAVPSVGRVTAIALPPQPMRAQTAAARKAGPASSAVARSIKLSASADARPGTPLSAQPRQDVSSARPAHPSSSETAVLPVPTVASEGKAAGLGQAEKRDGGKHTRIAAVLAIAAVAATLYAILPTSPRPAAPISPASAHPSPEDSLAPAVASPQDPDPKPIFPAKPDPIVVTLQAPPGTAGHASEYTVVRGDTLWQIAKKHVGDPFQYPELARLSHIRNPDRIHPGDIVRIEIREAR